MTENSGLRPQDVLAVRSRISWSAIFAGATLALAVYLILTLLGSAVGLSIRDRVQAESLGTGAAVWAILSTIVALFVGGWVTSQCTVGENQTEAVFHGVLVWGVLFAMMLGLVASGVRSGFSALVGMANVTQTATLALSDEGWEQAARRAGVSSEQIAEWRSKAAAAPEQVRQAVQSPANQERIAETATQAAWWTLVGIVLSMASAVLGSVIGSGPSLRLVPLSTSVARTRVVTQA